MKLTKLGNAFLTFTVAMLLIAGMLLRGAAQATPSDQSSATSGGDSTRVKIARQDSQDRRHRCAGRECSSARGEQRLHLHAGQS